MNHIEMDDAFRTMFENLSKYGVARHDEDKPLYKYVSIETARKILSNGTIKFSTPEELNDNDLDTSFLNPNVEPLSKIKIAQDIIRKHKGLYPELDRFIEDENSFAELNFLLTDEEFNTAMIQGYQEQRKNVGIFCVTTNNSSEYMWEKYGDNHKGICLEFKFPTLFNKIFYTFTVVYNLESKSGQLFNSDTSVNTLTINRWLFTKSKEYEIENEVRMITKNCIGIYPFPKKLLTGIHYGKNTSVKDIQEMKGLLKRGGYLFTEGKRISF